MSSRWRARRIGAMSVALVAVLAALALAQQARWPFDSPPRPLPARPVNFPPYEIKTLPNGMQVIVVLHHEQPVVTMRLIVRAGAAYDPPGKYGLATLLASLLDQGTTTRNAGQIADTIDFIGGGLNTGAATDLMFLNVLVMKDSFPLGMDLLADVTRNPAFDEKELNRQRQQALSSLQVSYDDPEYLASTVFERLIYGFHPYGMPNTGTPESIPNITREDIREYHRRYFSPNSSILAIVGDVTAPEAFAAAQRVFGDWPRQDIRPPTFSETPKPTRRIIVIDMPQAVQTEVRVGHLGVPRKQPDYMAVNLAIKILGGEGSNRLHRVLRTERGLTYGASVDMNTMLQGGDFVAETNTRSQATADVLRLTVQEFFRLQRERTDERELADAQAYITGNFPLTIETPNQIATQILNTVFYDLPLDELQTYRQRVSAVTVDDIQRAAQQHLQPDRLSIVLVGNTAAFKDQLRGAGFGDYEIVSLADLDLTSASFRRPVPVAGREPAGAGRANVRSASTLLTKPTSDLGQ